MADSLTLPQSFIDEMIVHAREDTPNECCGVVVRYPDGALKLYRTTNAEASPYRFALPPAELHYLFSTIEQQRADLFAIYHSHTQTDARPSLTDLRFAGMLEGPDPWPYWVLVSLSEEPPDVRAWRIQDGRETEVRLRRGDPGAGSWRCRLESSGGPLKVSVTEVPLSR